eukprot:3707527-Amphidinium_carterae.1
MTADSRHHQQQKRCAPRCLNSRQSAQGVLAVEGRTQEMHENVSPAQHLVHDGTLQRVWHEVEDDEPARKEAAMEAVETLSTADSLMRMVRANFNASAAILLADM